MSNMSLTIPYTNVSWVYKGTFNKNSFIDSYYWTPFKQLNNNALEYAFNNNIKLITTNEGMVVFNLEEMTMEIKYDNQIFIPVRIKRTL